MSALSEGQRDAWRKALAAKARDGRRQRYQPRNRTGQNRLPDVTAGMVRMPLLRNNGRGERTG